MKEVMRPCLRCFLFFIPTVVLWSGTLAAEDFDSAMRAYEKRDYAGPFKEFASVAAQGNEDAQFFLAAMYLLPQRDIPEGLKWLKLSVDQGMQDARFLLGMAYLKGQNFTHDPVQAYMWLELAAAQGGEFYQSQRNEAGR